MGFIKAFTGALGGTFADQWKDFYTVPTTITPTTALVKAVPQGTNAGRGQNTKGYENIISNGSKIVVPEGMALITMENGQITGLVAEPGGFIWQSNDPNSRSLFAGDGIISSTIGSTWEKFKFGGQPGAEQTAFYVNLKDIAGIRFGTQEPIQWYDNYYETRLSAMMRGTYVIKIVDPILFIKQFVPTAYLLPTSEPFDFNDTNDTTDQLFTDFTSSLSEGISGLALEASAANMFTYDYVSTNRSAFAKKMDAVLENNAQWTSRKGLSVANVSIIFNYDESSQAKIDEFTKDDQEIRRMKKMAGVYSADMAGAMAAASGSAIQNAASNPNGAMNGFIGMGFAQQQGASMLGAVNNMQQPQPQQGMYGQPQQPQMAGVAQAQQAPQQAPAEDPYAKLTEMKKLLDSGVITQEDFDAAKAKLLGL